MIDLEERVQRYVEQLTADAPPVSVDDVMYGPTVVHADHQPTRLLMVAAVVGLAVTGGVALMAARDRSPDTTRVDPPVSSAGTPTATVSPSTVAATAPAGSGPPVQGTPFTHAKFAEYLAAAVEVYGPLAVGASCDDLPEVPIDVFERLVVVPAVTQGPACEVLGWTYREHNGSAELPTIITENGHYEPNAIYDEVGHVIGYLSE